MGLVDAIDRIITRAEYDSKVVAVDGTEFHLFGRKAGGVGLARIESAVVRYWPAFTRRLGKSAKAAAVIDFEADLGGGPMDDYVVGIYSAPRVSADFQFVIEDACGFAPQASTAEYIRVEYSGFADPTQAYVDEMVSHELGHLYFGWGAFRVADLKDLSEVWFHLGMGMVYDREAWGEHSSEPSPLLQGLIDRYVNHYAKLPGVDARLIGADPSRDKELGLNRAQTIAHGKAYLFLSDLRRRIGEDAFDRHVRECLGRNSDKVFGYEEFVAALDPGTRRKVSEAEAAWRVR